MRSKIKRTDLENQLVTENTTLTNIQEEQTKLHLDYDAGLSRIQQLETELSDVLHYKQHILEKKEEAEILSAGESSKMGQLNFLREGQLEGRFLEKFQSRISEQQRIQQNLVETIKGNLDKIKQKTQLIEDEISSERKNVLNVDVLISTKQSVIEQQKIQIAQLEGNIRMLT